MNSQICIEAENEIQDLASLKETEVDFYKFAEQVVTLDQSFTALFDDPATRAKYEAQAMDDRFRQFRPELVDTIRALYDAFHRHAASTHDLACQVYKLGVLTQASYFELSKNLSNAFNKKLSRSYVYKLYMAGKVLSSAPALRIVPDIEKLAQIAKVPDGLLTSSIVAGPEVVRICDIDVNKTTRAQLGDRLQKAFPQHCAPKKQKPAAVTPPSNETASEAESWSLITLETALLVASEHLRDGDQELYRAVRQCLDLLDPNRNQKTSDHKND